MTKKDYELIAKVLNSVRRVATSSEKGIVNLTITDFTNALGMENPRFDRKKFLKECGWE